MGPVPHDSQSAVGEEGMIDKIIARIDRSLPIIHEKAASGGSVDTPTRNLSKAEFERAQAIFQDMSEDSILNDAEDDIRIAPKKKRQPSRINGKHP